MISYVPHKKLRNAVIMPKIGRKVEEILKTGLEKRNSVFILKVFSSRKAK